MQTPVHTPPRLTAANLQAAHPRLEEGSPNSSAGGVPLSFWESAHAVSVWQRLTVTCLGLIALVCTHYLFSHLHTILVPFFLSGFLVFALQPSVEVAFRLLAGLSSPHRWCICCCARRIGRPKRREGWNTSGSVSRWGFQWLRSPTIDEEAATEHEPLLEQVPTWAAMLGEAAARFTAVAFALLFMLFVASIFLFLLGHGAMHMKEHWSAYKTGLERLQKMQDHVIDIASEELDVKAEVDVRLKNAYDTFLASAQGLVWTIVNAIVAGASEGVSKLLIVLLYVMFWLMQPLPIGGKASSVVRSYLWKKTFVSFLYGGSVALLFLILGIDLSIFFGVVSFFLNFVPEVGAFISMLVPVPVILLDGRLQNPLLALAAATIGQVLLKFAIGNILEVKLIERDREMNIHPVWIILGLSYFGFIWGPLGALISVPMLAMLKTAALSARGDPLDAQAVVPALAESFLACFEGRNTCWLREGRGATLEQPRRPGMPHLPTPTGAATPGGAAQSSPS